MARFKMEAGNIGRAVIDHRQPGIEADLGIYHDGPIDECLWGGEGTLPVGTLLIGELWVTSGRRSNANRLRAYGRYTEARTPKGDIFPICMILGDEDGLEQKPDSPPGAAKLPRRQPVTAVKRFVFEE